MFFVIRLDTDKLKSKAKFCMSCADIASMCIPFVDMGTGERLNLDCASICSEDRKEMKSFQRAITDL